MLKLLRVTIHHRQIQRQKPQTGKTTIMTTPTTTNSWLMTMNHNCLKCLDLIELAVLNRAREDSKIELDIAQQ